MSFFVAADRIEGTLKNPDLGIFQVTGRKSGFLFDPILKY